MKVRIGDIIKNLERLKLDTSLFGNRAGRFLINNQNALEFKPTVRTGNFWRAEISEQGSLELIGEKVIAILARAIHDRDVSLNTPDRFIADWTIAAFDSIVTPSCLAIIDTFEKGDFLKPKIRNIMNNKQVAFRSIRRLPRKTLLEIDAVLLDFDRYYKSGHKGKSYMDSCLVIFQHGFVLDSDPARITLREFWNSTMDAEGMARVISVMTEEDFTGRQKIFSFDNA